MCNEKDRREVFLELTAKGQQIIIGERQKILDVLTPLGNKLTFKELEELRLHLTVIDSKLNIIKKEMVKNED